jgi:hypothetical protein
MVMSELANFATDEMCQILKNAIVDCRSHYELSPKIGDTLEIGAKIARKGEVLPDWFFTQISWCWPHDQYGNEWNLKYDSELDSPALQVSTLYSAELLLNYLEDMKAQHKKVSITME